MHDRSGHALESLNMDFLHNQLKRGIRKLASLVLGHVCLRLTAWMSAFLSSIHCWMPSVSRHSCVTTSASCHFVSELMPVSMTLSFPPKTHDEARWRFQTPYKLALLLTQCNGEREDVPQWFGRSKRGLNVEERRAESWVKNEISKSAFERVFKKLTNPED